MTNSCILLAIFHIFKLDIASRGTRKYSFWEAGGHDRVFVYTVLASLNNTMLIGITGHDG